MFSISSETVLEREPLQDTIPWRICGPNHYTEEKRLWDRSDGKARRPFCTRHAPQQQRDLS